MANGGPNPPKPAPRGVRLPTRVEQPIKALAPLHKATLAEAGNVQGAGMGIGMAVRSGALAGLIQKAEKVSLGQQDDIDASCIPDPVASTFSCGAIAAGILAGGALGPGVAPGIFDFQDYQGFVGFNRRAGKHTINLSCGVSRNGSRPSGQVGAINIPVGKVFILTGFVAHGMLNNVGLPGAFEAISPVALVGSVVFGLVTATGVALNASTTLSNGSCETVNGTSILFRDIMQGSVPQSFMFPEGSSVRAFYEVVSPVYRCFPSVVGVEVTGYMVSAELVSEAIGDGTAAGSGCGTLAVRKK